MHASLAVMGELPEDAVAGYDNEGDDLMPALAHKLISDETHAELVESVSAQAQPTRISWAEFLADQPEPPKRTRRTSDPAGPSLFEWVLEREQEGGLAAAGG